MNTCFFIGHRDAPDKVLPLLEEEVERHITAYGVGFCRRPLWKF